MSHNCHQNILCLFVTLKILAQSTTQHILYHLEKASPALCRARVRHGHKHGFHHMMHRAMYYKVHGHHQCFGRFSPWSNTMADIFHAHSHRGIFARCFSTLNSRLVNRRPTNIFQSNHMYNLMQVKSQTLMSRTFFSAVGSFFTRERSLFIRFLDSRINVSDTFALESRKVFESHKFKRFLHNYGQPLKPLEIKSDGHNKHSRPKRVQPRHFANKPSFIFPQTSLHTSFSTESLSSASSSSIPSLRDLRRAYHTTPEVGSYVDFDMSPTITIPTVTQLSAEIVDNLTEDIERHIAQLQAMAENVKKLASLGELPISVENNSLRVYFPNCEPEQVNSLLNSTEVTQGIIRSHNDSRIVSPLDSASESSSQSSSYMDTFSSFSSFPLSISEGEQQTPDFGPNGFYYAEMDSVSRRNSLSSGSWDIARLRGFTTESEASPSLIPPSLTNAPSGETVSEGSSVLFG